MTIYAKLLSETSIDRSPPRSAVIDGAFVCGTLPRDYLATLGYYPLRETPAPAPAEGCHVEPRYALDGGEIVQSWAQVENPPPPPRTFSKIKLKGAIAEAGLLDEFKAMLETIEVKPGYTAAEAFADAVTLDEDHPDFKDAVALAQRELGIPQELIDRILAASVAG